MESKWRYGWWVVLFSMSLSMGCEDQLAAVRDQLSGFWVPLTPRQAYLRTATRQNVLDSTQVAQWQVAYRAALADTLVGIDLPHREPLRYSADPTTTAASYRLHLPAGRLLRVAVAEDHPETPIFGELFLLRSGQLPNPNRALVRWDTTSNRLQYETSDPAGQDLLLVVQAAPTDSAEAYAIVLRTEPVLTFPVAGKNDRAILSFWGDSRSGGARQHEGNDIFAPRGTPVVAVADGRVRSTRISERGGKTVWLRDAEGREVNYYYAHLDSQLVRRGDFVERGDTIGLVGNTGNARTTPPHLHFGIYRRGARDPWEYLRRAD
jgi:murein DD-endopeptidase MepM/ murein hydrolase activator NlpD